MGTQNDPSYNCQQKNLHESRTASETRGRLNVELFEFLWPIELNLVHLGVCGLLGKNDAAINDDSLPGHVIAVLAGQETHRASHIFRNTRSA